MEVNILFPFWTQGGWVSEGAWQQLHAVFEWVQQKRQTAPSSADEHRQAPPLCRQMANSLLLSSAYRPPKYKYTHMTPLKAPELNHPFPNPATWHALFSFPQLLFSFTTAEITPLQVYQQILKMQWNQTRPGYPCICWALRYLEICGLISGKCGNQHNPQPDLWKTWGFCKPFIWTLYFHCFL